MEKIPRLRLLHSRKQEIIIKDLYDGYDAQRANQLLRRKMKLDESAWGHLIYFGGPRRTFICTFPQMPEPQALRDAVVKFHENHVAESILESEIVQSPETLAFAEKHGLSNITPPNASIIIAATNSPSIARIDQAQELDSIHVSHFKRTIEFSNMRKKVHLSPVCFAIYCMYLDASEGIINKERCDEEYNYEENAKYHYRRIWGSDDIEDVPSAIHNCFIISDDKPFRDAVYKIKKEIIKTLGNNELAKQYYVTGQNGGLKRISIPRQFVQYDND